MKHIHSSWIFYLYFWKLILMLRWLFVRRLGTMEVSFHFPVQEIFECLSGLTFENREWKKRDNLWNHLVMGRHPALEEYFTPSPGPTLQQWRCWSLSSTDSQFLERQSGLIPRQWSALWWPGMDRYPFLKLPRWCIVLGEPHWLSALRWDGRGWPVMRCNQMPSHMWEIWKCFFSF